MPVQFVVLKHVVPLNIDEQNLAIDGQKAQPCTARHAAVSLSWAAHDGEGPAPWTINVGVG